MPGEHIILPNDYCIAHINAGETAMLYHEIFLKRRYIQHGITLRPGDVVFDVGANIGMAALFFHTQCPGVRVFSFEPAPVPFAALTENMRSHGIPGLARQLALADAPGKRMFSYYPNNTVMSGFYADASENARLLRAFLINNGVDDEDNLDFLISGKHEKEQFTAELSTLSEVIRSTQVSGIALLKIDVEKSEVNVIRGLADGDWPKVRQVVAEVHDIDGALREFCRMLQAHGFEITVDQDSLLRGTEIWEVFAVRGADDRV